MSGAPQIKPSNRPDNTAWNNWRTSRIEDRRVKAGAARLL